MLHDENEIGDGASLNREMLANKEPTPVNRSPTSPPIGSSETKVQRKRATVTPSPQNQPPTSSPIGPVSNGEAGGDGQALCATQANAAIAATASELVSLQRQRQFGIVQKNRSERAIESLIASAMGFRLDAPEKDRKAVFARAKAFRLAVERGGEGQAGSDDHTTSALSAIAPLILISAQNRTPWVDLRSKVEKDMQKLAKKLPVYEFAKSVRGFGDLGLACLTAEAGIPIGDYRTVSGLWKRMGLAVFDGARQQKMRDKEKAELHGYSPKRRAEVWAFCSDSMFRAQWRGADEEAGTQAGPIGPYGEVYAHRRAVTEPRIEATADLPTTDRDKWTKGRCHNDARRIMSKALLRDLWRVWRGIPPVERRQPLEPRQDGSRGFG